MFWHRTTGLSIGWLTLILGSCSYYQNELIIPPVPEEKPTLEAVRVSTPPVKLNDPYWSTADFLRINATDIVTGQVSPGEARFNTNNMPGGISDFNGGAASQIILRAAYDDQYLYILATWQDNTYQASSLNWLFNGPADPAKPGDTAGWTSQRSSDHLALSFAGNSGSRDIWKWSLAVSEPMGFAIDQYDAGAGWVNDAGEPMFSRNIADDADPRSGPAYEWNGQLQEMTRDPGGYTVLDPGFFLLNAMPFSGDIANGELLYQSQCAFCHGASGEGGGFFLPSSPPLNQPGYLNRRTREALSNFIGDEELHKNLRGPINWNRLTDAQRDDILARLRSISGVPGHVLDTPSGSSADVRAFSNVLLGRIEDGSENKGYKVLLVRKLQTNNADDVQFNLVQQREYEFNIYLSDNDDLNRVGQENKKLTFR
jgi:mono/diheme cytochrome c family protein